MGCHAVEDDNAQLKRIKYNQKDLFVIDALDVIIKDDLPSMEYPFYSLSKKPDREVRRYEYKDKWIEFRPSVKGLPTIYDKDLIIYAISHLITLLEDGKEPPKEVEIDPYAFFLFTERGTGGRDYDALRDSLDRLDGTRFRTNINMNGTMVDEWQGIIDKASLTTNSKNGKPQKLRITLSDMVMSTIKGRQVLTLNRNYFRLKKPIERRIYELARKHTGHQPRWEVYLDTLHSKSGSRSGLPEFRRAVKHLFHHDHLPDYHLIYDETTDKVTFRPRDDFIAAYDKPEVVIEGEAASDVMPPLELWAIEKAKLAAPGMDVYALEIDWRMMWHETGRKKFDNHNAAFIGFCKKAYSISQQKSNR